MSENPNTLNCAANQQDTASCHMLVLEQVPSNSATSVDAKATSFQPDQQVLYLHEERMQALGTKTVRKELQCP